MNTLHPYRRTIAALMLGVFAIASFAPVAEAGHRRWKGGRPVREVRYVQPGCEAPRVTYYQRSSNAGPVLAGIVGGLVLGAALANAHPVVHAEYSYWDPYCHEDFATLDGYRSHLYRHRHPRVIRVIEVSSGDCVRSMEWRGGDWRTWDDDEDWDD